MVQRRNKRAGTARLVIACAVMCAISSVSRPRDVLAQASAPPRAPVRPTAMPAAPAADTIDPMSRALAAEDKNDLKAAAAAYREVIQRALASVNADGDRVAIALLGLERTWADIGIRDSILPIVGRVLQVRPTDPVARSMQLRALMATGKDDETRMAFLNWRRVAGNDGAPYREYSRLLLAAGRAQAADSVLNEAGRLLGAGGALSGEVAQLHVALGRWNSAAVAFREALVAQPYLETAAEYALARAPIPTRDSIRTVLSAPPAALPPRRLLASLELFWGEPRRAWTALSSVRADDSTTAAWREFGERAEMAQSWSVARDVWLAVLERRGDLEAQQRAAQAALKANDAAGALDIARRPAPPSPAAKTKEQRARALLPIELAALGELGRPLDAQKRLDEDGKSLDPATRATIAQSLVGAWLRSGDVEKARQAVAGSELADDDETMGWLALYDGDLVTARKRLVRAETRRPQLVDALGLLARARVDRSVGLGEAFLLLARRDTTGAARRFLVLADSMTDAAPALMALAARLQYVRSAPTPSMTIWDRIIKTYPKSPEAPDALLSSARALRDTGNTAGAIARYESLLVDYPDSALSPQGRRELSQLKGGAP
jgi:tetratricopeptide (TPR) repeat protein